MKRHLVVSVVRDAAIVVAATFVAGFLVATALGEANRDTPVWRVSLTVTSAIFCVGAFFTAAHLTTANRLVHVWIVAALSSLPNLAFFAIRDDMTLAAFVMTFLLMLVYASIGAGISYVVRKVGRGVTETAI
jgi:hypothetical protein